MTSRANGATLGCAKQRATFFYLSLWWLSLVSDRKSDFFFFSFGACFLTVDAVLHQPTQCELQQAESAVHTATETEKKFSHSRPICAVFPLLLFQANVKVEKNVNDLSIHCL